MTTQLIRKTGWQTATAETIDADAFAATYVMQRDIHPKRMLEAAENAAPALGYGRAAMSLLRILHNMTRHVDWEDGRPISFASNEMLAWECGVTVSAIKKQLRELARMGLITRSGDSNGKRSGGRYGSGPRKGHLRDDTTGINLAPLAAKFHIHCQAAEDHQRAREMMKTMSTTARRFIRNIGQMQEQCLSYKIPTQLWKSAHDTLEMLGPQVIAARHHRKLEAMSDLVNQLGRVHTLISSVLRDFLIESANQNQLPQGGNYTPQIPTTTPSNFCETIRPSEDGGSDEILAPSLTEEHELTHTEHGSIKATEMPFLFPNACDYLPELTTCRSWEAIGRLISQGRHSLIGLKHETWIRALNDLPIGYPQMMFTIALEWMDAAPNRNGGGYFIGMWKKYDGGQLKLHGTIMGRRKMLA